uniref:hypothetical protein n=1 Tax=Yoonia sp. TaxID=2212373 RepID=UPI0035C85FB0
ISFVLKISRLQIAAYVSVRFSGGSSLIHYLAQGVAVVTRGFDDEGGMPGEQPPKPVGDVSAS